MKWIVSILVISILSMQLAGQESGTVNLEQARKLYDQGNLEEALEAVNRYIEEVGDEPKALGLKEAIVSDLNLVRSRDLTNRALLLIDRNDFAGAETLLGEALLADPSNALAMDLYVSLAQVTKAESARTQITDAGETGTEEDGTGAAAAAATVAVVSGDQKSDGIEDSAVKSGRTPSKVPFGFSAGPRITFANSNYLSLDSSVTLLGVMADAWIFLPFWDTRLGFSAAYAGDFLKLSGNDSINFTTNQIKASALIRTWIFRKGDNRTTIMGGIGYNYFSLNNKEALGAYLIKGLSGPRLSFYISDPIFARFVTGNFVKNLTFKLNVGGTFSSGASGVLYGIDSGFRISYDFGLMGISLGYDFFGLYLGTTVETYQSLSLTGDIKF